MPERGEDLSGKLGFPQDILGQFEDVYGDSSEFPEKVEYPNSLDLDYRIHGLDTDFVED